MTDQETLNRNKLIAEFMGFKMVVSDYHGINIIEAPTGRSYDLHGLKYHCSWDWLMPACKKADSIRVERESQLHFLQEMINGHLDLYDISATFRELVEFIEEYNRTKNEPNNS